MMLTLVSKDNFINLWGGGNNWLIGFVTDYWLPHQLSLSADLDMINWLIGTSAQQYNKSMH